MAKKELNSRKISLKVTPSLYERIEKQSDELGILVSSVVKMAIIDYLTKMEKLQLLKDQTLEKELEKIKKINEY